MKKRNTPSYLKNYSVRAKCRFAGGATGRKAWLAHCKRIQRMKASEPDVSHEP